MATFEQLGYAMRREASRLARSGPSRMSALSPRTGAEQTLVGQALIGAVDPGAAVAGDVWRPEKDQSIALWGRAD